jgi:hypothetical protein
VLNFVEEALDAAAPAIRPALSGCTPYPNQPNLSIASDIEIFAVILSPAYSPVRPGQEQQSGNDRPAAAMIRL